MFISLPVIILKTYHRYKLQLRLFCSSPPLQQVFTSARGKWEPLFLRLCCKIQDRARYDMHYKTNRQTNKSKPVIF